MRGIGVLTGAAATALAVAGSLVAGPSAHASNYGLELNGTYRVTSNGDWAQTNRVYMNEKTVVQTWTVSTSCKSPIECTGQMTSDQGWTAPINLAGSYWIVERDVPNWVPCPDGTAAPGHQMFMVWGADVIKSERNLKITDLLVGRDITKGPSGACGINKPVDIELPVRLDKV